MAKENECPHCGSEGYETSQEGQYRCRRCKKTFGKRRNDPLMGESFRPLAENIVEVLLDQHDFEVYGDETPVHCPMCGGHGVPLGALGRVMHYRCRQCGWDFSEDDSQSQGQTPPKACAMPRPKADLMPGGSMGPVGDTTAIGIPGGGN